MIGAECGVGMVDHETGREHRWTAAEDADVGLHHGDAGAWARVPRSSHHMTCTDGWSGTRTLLLGHSTQVHEFLHLDIVGKDRTESESADCGP